MPELTDIVQQLTPEKPSLESLISDCRLREKAHELNVRFHLAINLAFAALTTLILKIDGPWYADAICAGLFACGAALSLFSWRSVRRTADMFHTAEARRREEAERAPRTECSRTV